MKSFSIVALVASASAVIHTAHVPSQGVFLTVDRPAEDSMMQFRQHKAWAINDVDGDGVEDNVHKTHDELDRYYIPNRFFPTEHIYNTRHGNLPGHIQKGFYDLQPEPASMELTKKDWQKW